MKLRKMQDIDLAWKKVFLRCDVNVPLDQNGNVQNFKRITYILDTINYLLEKRCSIIIASHLWRPNNGYEKRYSLSPVQKVLKALLRWPVLLAPWLTDETTLYLANVLKQKEILILENTRFHPWEKTNSEELSQTLASMADIYINDAFWSCHREHSSVNGITQFFPPEKRWAWLLLQKEFSYFHDTIHSASSPFIAILGWAKVSDKLLAINKLLEKVDKIIIGWAMAFTFLKALWFNVWNSLVEDDLLDEVLEVVDRSRDVWKEIVLPLDFVISKTFSEKWEIKTTPWISIPDWYMWLDIWPKSIEYIKEKTNNAQTIFWNWPMWAYEMESFFEWSRAIWNILSKNKNLTFVGWWDSISVIQTLGIDKNISHISTGWWMSLCLIEWKKLPTLEKISY